MPDGYGMVKLDKNSTPVWSYLKRAHGAFDVAPDGRVFVFTAMQAMGQGIESSYVQIVSEALDIEAERIVVVQPTTYGLDNRCQLDAMATFGDAARGVMVVDLRNGRTVATLTFAHTIDELYDVAVMPGVREPEAVGFVGTDIETHVRAEPPG